MPKKLDEQGNEIVASEEEENLPVPTKVVEAKPVPTEKLELSPEELDERIAAGVAAKLAQREEEIRLEEAKKQGDYKKMYEDSEKARVKASLSLWRTKALSKYKLSDAMFDALSGETEDEIFASAKKLKSTIDAEIQARLEASGERETPPEGRGKSTPPKDTKVSPDVQTRNNLKVALGLGQIRH